MANVQPRERFARNLRTLRAQRRLSQEALGARAGIHRTEVSLLERGQRDPRLTTIARLARALDIEAAELIAGI
jgi:transcriptional regulator with XRE-family HTH domain